MARSEAMTFRWFRRNPWRRDRRPIRNASIRKDYELAMQLGTRDVWEAFLRSYPEGFYADLAKAQLRKVAAEEARAAAVEKARLAEQEKARLAAAEGARQAEQAKAAAAAKAAEEARISAEKARQIEQEKAAAAERARVAAQEKVRIAAEKARQAEQEKAAAAEQARLVAEKEAADKKEKLAALAPAAKADEPQVDLPRALQSELRRVGCNTGTVDGNWSAASQKALDQFNRHAGTRLDVTIASADALDVVRGKTGRICPLICETGYRAEDDRCVKIACRAGYRLNDEGHARKPAAGNGRPRQAETLWKPRLPPGHLTIPMAEPGLPARAVFVPAAARAAKLFRLAAAPFEIWVAAVSAERSFARDGAASGVAGKSENYAVIQWLLLFRFYVTICYFYFS